MKKSVFAIIICTIGLLITGCNNGPFDETKCTVEGVLVLRPNPCFSNPCMPGMGWWLQTKDKSYVIDGEWITSDIELNVNGTIVHVGDSVKVTGMSCSYRDCNKSIFYSLKIESLEILVSVEELVSQVDTTLTGKLYVYPDKKTCYIASAVISKNCYTPNEDWSCLTIAGTEICKEEDTHWDYIQIPVEVQGTLYTFVNPVTNFEREEIDIKQMRLLD